MITEIKLIPSVQEFSCTGDIINLTEKAVEFDFNRENEILSNGARYVKKSLSELGFQSGNGEVFLVTVRVCENNEKLKNIKSNEAYTLQVTKDGAEVTAKDIPGAFYGLVTLSKLFEKKNGTVSIPVVSICDYPEFPDRGQFIESRYGTEFLTKENWFDMIDYFAKMKYNKIIVSLYGCWPVQYDYELQEYLFVPFKNHPGLKTPKPRKYYSPKKGDYVTEENVLPPIFAEDFFGEVVAYGKKRCIDVEPMFNSLGHNTLIPRVYPKLSAKDENGNDTGFGFCTESEETFDFMCGLYDEIMEKYMNPHDIKSISIGLDEVLDSIGIDRSDMKKKFSHLCKCENCRNYEEKELVIRYIIKICKYLKSKGIKNIYIYQDMLLYSYDTINEDLKKRFVDEDIYDVAVIDWWSYDAGEKLFEGRIGDVNNIFRSTMKPMTGYYQWSIATETNQNIKECVKLAKDLNFEGVRVYTGFDYCYDKNFLYQADVIWNTKGLENDCFEEKYAYSFESSDHKKLTEAFVAMSEIMRHDNKENHMHNVFEYYMHSYFRANLPYPRNYPSEAFVSALDDEEKYITYLENVNQKAGFALDVFKSHLEKSPMADMWILNALQYKTDTNEFLTLINLYKSFGTDTTQHELLAAVKELIVEREKMMSFAQMVKIEANAVWYLRNMSVMLQYLKDLESFITDKISKGEIFDFDIRDQYALLSEKSLMLR
ncbi:MAG: family 20 glycosylhydrolase [Clostridia bacterium]|nr:family 20 glycosylhydrolase [Clostridia bacterium]